MGRSRWLHLLIILMIYLGSRAVLERQNEQQTINQPLAPNPPVQPSPPVLNHPPTEITERQIHDKINNYRVSRGLTPLTMDYRMTNEARKYSAKMASGEATFSHDGFEDRIANLEKQALQYHNAAENLALLQGYDDLATVAVEGWIDSPGHHKNIIGDYDLTGIGVAKNDEDVYYFTQLFLKRR